MIATNDSAALAALVADYERTQDEEREQRNVPLYAAAVARAVAVTAERDREMGRHETAIAEALADLARANGRCDAAGAAKMVAEAHYCGLLGQLRLALDETQPRLLRDAQADVAERLRVQCERAVSGGAADAHEENVLGLYTARDSLAALVGVPLADLPARIEQVLAAIPPGAPDFAPMPPPEPPNLVAGAFQRGREFISEMLAQQKIDLARGQ